MIKDLFPHVGELILEQIIAADASNVLDKFQLNDHKSKFIGIHRQIPIVFPNSDVMFDGFSTIDLGLQFDDDTIFPIEVKLGHTGLARGVINKKLRNCTISRHTSKARISGNVLAVLNRYFDSQLTDLISSDFLHARLGNRELAITPEWGIIARSHILDSWKRYPPNFNGKIHTLSLERICSGYGHEAFNRLVESILSSNDYFSQWVGTKF